MNEDVGLLVVILVVFVVGVLVGWGLTGVAYEKKYDSPVKAWAIYQEQVDLAETRYREAFGK